MVANQLVIDFVSTEEAFEGAKFYQGFDVFYNGYKFSNGDTNQGGGRVRERWTNLCNRFIAASALTGQECKISVALRHLSMRWCSFHLFRAKYKRDFSSPLDRPRADAN